MIFIYAIRNSINLTRYSLMIATIWTNILGSSSTFSSKNFENKTEVQQLQNSLTDISQLSKLRGGKLDGVTIFNTIVVLTASILNNKVEGFQPIKPTHHELLDFPSKFPLPNKEEMFQLLKTSSLKLRGVRIFI